MVAALVASACQPTPSPSPTPGATSTPSSPPAGTADSCPDLLIVPCQFQSVELSIPIVGTALSLHYSSTRAAGRKVAPVGPLPTDIGGWSISVLDRLDVGSGLWEGGDGSRRHITPIKVADHLVVASADGRFADVFDGQGRELRRIDALTKNDLDRFTWDGDALTAITDSHGETKLQHGPDGAVTSIIGPLGAATAVSIASDGTLVSLFRQSGRSDHFSYAAGGLLTGWTDANGASTTWSYDPDGRLASIHDPVSGTTTFTTSANGPNGLTVTATRNGAAASTQWQTIAIAGGTSWSMTTPSGARISEDVVADSRTIHLGDGTVEQLSLAPDPEWAMQFPVVTALDITSPSGRTLHAGEDRSVSAPADPTTPHDWVRTVTLGSAKVVQRYTAETSTLTSVSADQRTRSIVFGAFDRVMSVSDPTTVPLSYHYDDHGRVTSVDAGSGAQRRTYKLAWDPNEPLLQVTDPLGRTASLAFDADGNLQVVSRADGQRVVVDRSPAGTPATVTVNGQPVMAIGTDGGGRLTSYGPAGPGGLDLTSTTYDNGALTGVANADGTTVSLRYDAAGRLAALNAGNGDYSPAFDSKSGILSGWSGPGGEQEAFTFDASAATGITWKGLLTASVTIALDGLGRSSSIAFNGGPPIDIGYDADGLITSLGDLAIKRDSASGLSVTSSIAEVQTASSFDELGLPASMTATGPAGALFEEHAKRDAIGRLVALDVTIDGTRNQSQFEYDLAGRLTSVTSASGALRLHYDGLDNLISVDGAVNTEFTVDDRGEVLTAGTTHYTWSAAGALASIAKSSGDTTTFAFDGLIQLTSVKLPDGRRLTYLYDESGRRIARLIDGKLDAGYLYVPGVPGPAAVVDGSGAVAATFGYMGPGAPALMERDGRAYRILSDHLGSPRLVVDAQTGEVVERLDYDLLGRITRDSNPGFQPFGFAGGLVDRDTGFVRLGIRDYDPAIGRWITRDRSLLDGGVNPYEYAADDWVNLVDRTGRAPEPLSPEEQNVDQVTSVESKATTAISGYIALTSQAPSVEPQGLFTGKWTWLPGEEPVLPAEIPTAGWGDQGLAHALSPGAEAPSKFLPGIGIALGAADVIASAIDIDQHGANAGNVGGLLGGLGGILVSAAPFTGPAAPVVYAIGAALSIIGAGLTLYSYLAGDPHLVSWDGNFFDFQGAGEYTLVHDPGGGLDVQVRLEPRGTSRSVSVATAIAIGLPQGHRVGIYREGRNELLVDGRPVDLPVGILSVGPGGTVSRLPNGHYVVAWTDGSFAVEVSAHGGASENFRLAVNPQAGRHLVGLLGSPDGDLANDFALRDGTLLSNPGFADIHHRFGESWRLTANESLFDYAPGKSTASYADPSFPDHDAALDDLDSASRAAATAICRGAGISAAAVVDACILDVAVLQDPTLAGGLVDLATGAGPAPVTGTRTSFVVTVGTVVGPDTPAGAGRIDQANGEQRYQATVDGNSAIYLAAQKGCSGTPLYWTVVLPDGSSIPSFPDICTDIGPVRFSTPGTVTISVVSRGATGTYGFSILQSEPVQQFSVAAGATIGAGNPGPGAGSIDRPGGEDRYTISDAAGQAVYVAAIAGCAEEGLLWDVVRADGSMQGGPATLCSDRGVIRFPAAETWTIEVQGNGQATGAYGFQVLASEPVQFFNVTLGTPVTPGVPAVGAGRIDAPGGEDRYLFHADAGQTFSITPGSDCAVGHVQAFLARPGTDSGEAQSTAEASAYGGIYDLCSSPIVTQSLDRSGTWGLVVVGLGTATGDYSFTIAAH